MEKISLRTKKKLNEKKPLKFANDGIQNLEKNA